MNTEWQFPAAVGDGTHQEHQAVHDCNFDAIALVALQREAMKQRAAESARLRAENVRLRTEIAALINDIDRLVAAIRHIANAVPGPDQSRIAQGEPLDTVIVAGGLCIYHGPDREVLCASCMEPSGTCTLTGGREPCDGAADAAALVAEAAAAPTITIQTGAAT